MTIVFYEFDYAKKLLAEGTGQIRQKDLNILAKYWEHDGLTYPQIRDKVEEFCKKNNKNFNSVLGSDKLDRAVRYARSNQIRFPVPVNVTQAELDRIKTIDNYKIEKFLFSMLVVAKYFKANPSRKKTKTNSFDNDLYSNSAIADIKEIAGVQFTKADWKRIKHELTIKGLISPTIVNSNRWAIGFEDPTGEVAITVDDYRNIVAYYQEYSGESLVECEKCRVKIVKKSNRQKYCKSCWKIVTNEQKAIWKKNAKQK